MPMVQSLQLCAIPYLYVLVMLNTENNLNDGEEKREREKFKHSMEGVHLNGDIASPKRTVKSSIVPLASYCQIIFLKTIDLRSL